jgi:hypothetical protein
MSLNDRPVHEYRYHALWNRLNPSSYWTLRSLTLVFVTTLHVTSTFQDIISAAKERYLNTFHGDAALTTLVRLTHLRILIIIQGERLLVGSGCRDYLWNELSDETKRIGESVPTLSEVRFMLHIRKQKSESEVEPRWEVPADPYDDLPDFADIPQQNRFETSDGPGHSLKVAVSTGPCVDRRHPRMKYVERNL